jgi:hypothetical protein
MGLSGKCQRAPVALFDAGRCPVAEITFRACTGSAGDLGLAESGPTKPCTVPGRNRKARNGFLVRRSAPRTLIFTPPMRLFDLCFKL